MKDCIDRSLVELRPYQKKAIRYLRDHDTLLVAHGTGTGKTLTAVAASQCYLDSMPNNTVIVISPSTLIDNFKKEMKKYGLDSESHKKYKFYSFTEYNNKCKNDILQGLVGSCKSSFLIIDEAHNIRNEKGVTYNNILVCAKQADKVLLLTATPYVNDVSDVESLINILNREIYMSDYFKTTREYKEYYKIYPDSDRNSVKYIKSLAAIERMLKGKVSYENDKKTDNFPDVIESKVTIKMSTEFYISYLKSLYVDKVFGAKPEAFYHGIRRGVNESGLDEFFEQYYSTKINRLPMLINSDKGPLQTLVFTNWIRDGISIIRTCFDNIGVNYRIISGQVPLKSRTEYIRMYNAGEVNVLVITKAGSEGIDLVGTRNIIIVDPVWNYAGIEQIIGRGSRYLSHAHLPKEERVVHVYQMITTAPSDWEYLQKVTLGFNIPKETGDEQLYKFIEEKQLVNQDITTLFQLCSI